MRVGVERARLVLRLYEAEHVGLHLAPLESLLIAVLFGLALMGLGIWRERSIGRSQRKTDSFGFEGVERVSSVVKGFCV